MLEHWILEQNLRPLVEFGSVKVGYEFDDLDWDAISHGVEQTDVEANAWFEYRLDGRESVELHVARDPGSIVLFVKVAATPETLMAFETALELMQSYVLVSERP